jgi:hypothetical protein
MTLGDLFSADELLEIRGLLQNPDYLTRIRALKAHLQQFKERLDAKGILPDYLAYVLENMRSDLLAHR